MKLDEKEKARTLRMQGLSLKQIAKDLQVAKSSVSLWVRDISLSDEHRQALKKRGGAGTDYSQRTKAFRDKRAEYQSYGARLVRVSDPDFIAGCMLYWAEGAKNKNSLKFVNSDFNMIMFFKKFLEKYFNLGDADFKISLNFFTDLHSKKEVEAFWLGFLKLPESCLNKSIINYHSNYSNKKRKNKLEYGVCALVVNKTYVVQSIFGAIQEYIGFSNAGWLG